MRDAAVGKGWLNLRILNNDMAIIIISRITQEDGISRERINTESHRKKEYYAQIYYNRRILMWSPCCTRIV